jgi:hypothetical protein
MMALPPVQTFYQLMAWVQRSPVAMALNLFQEAALLPESVPPLPWRFDLKYPNSPTSWQVPPQIDYTLARLEAADISPVVDSTATLFQRGRTWLLQQFKIGTAKPVPPVARSQSPSSSKPKSSVSEQPDWELYAPAQPQTLKTPFWQFPLSSNQPSNQSATASSTLAPTEQSVPLSPASGQEQAGEKMRSHLALNQSASQTESFPVARAASQSEAAASSASSTSLSQSDTRSAKPDVTWIEPKVSVIGYVKHPLEHLLEWIDRGMLWLENRFIHLGNWFKKLWQSDRDSDANR